MKYSDFNGKKISALGFGTMRLPVKNDVYSDIDFELSERMFELAIEGGVNYFDTAWGYHDGESEPAVGKLLKKYPRESFFLATKFPGYDLNNFGKAEEIFNKQSERCGTDYFDFYLFHNVCEMNIDAYLNEERYHTFSVLKRFRDEGRIKHLGFSAHGDLGVIRRFLEAYGSDMEFCQLQINWFDWKFQDAREKVELLKEYSIPVWVMEPVRGGRLAALEAKDEAVLKRFRPEESIASWAFRFLQAIPEVKVTLSGMSTLEEVADNLKTFNTGNPLSAEELTALEKIADRMISEAKLPCTACRYCTSHCPKHLDIPELIALYNEHRFTGGGFIAPMALSAVPEDKQPSACIGCRSCEKVCPQQIKISEVMRDFVKRLK